MVMPNMPTEGSTETGPGMEEGRGPTVVPSPVAASPELTGRPRRRTFTVKDKLRILADTDHAAGTGGGGRGGGRGGGAGPGRREGAGEAWGSN